MKFQHVFHSVLMVVIGCLVLGAIKVHNIINDRPIAIVKHFKPNVDISTGDQSEPKRLDLETDKAKALYDGDTLRTDKNGYALVVFMDKSIAKVKPQSLLVVRGESEKTSKRSNTRIDLSLGEILLNVEPQGNNDFEVSTSRSLASVKGTVFGGNSNGYVWVKEGQVDVMAKESGETISLFKQMFAQVNDTGEEISSGNLSEEELEQFEEDFQDLNEDLLKKKIKVRFKDANGQIREIEIDYFEKGN